MITPEYSNLKIDSAQNKKILKKHYLKIIDWLIENGLTPYRPYFINISAVKTIEGNSEF